MASCGQRPDGLTTTGLNKGFGGAQPKVRLRKVEEVDVDNIGINATVLTLKLGDRLHITNGDVQSMQYLPPDVGQHTTGRLG